jgi:hypothetical protein
MVAVNKIQTNEKYEKRQVSMTTFKSQLSSIVNNYNPEFISSIRYFQPGYRVYFWFEQPLKWFQIFSCLILAPSLCKNRKLAAPSVVIFEFFLLFDSRAICCQAQGLKI